MTTAIDAVDTATAAVTRLYRLGTKSEQMVKDAQGAVLYPYGLYSASLGRGDTYTLDDVEGVRWARVVGQFFGRTADSALAKAEEFRLALVGIRPAITGYATSAVHAELDPVVVRDPDDTGVIGVTATFTFTATKES